MQAAISVAVVVVIFALILPKIASYTSVWHTLTNCQQWRGVAALVGWFGHVEWYEGEPWKVGSHPRPAASRSFPVMTALTPGTRIASLMSIDVIPA